MLPKIFVWSDSVLSTKPWKLFTGMTFLTKLKLYFRQMGGSAAWRLNAPFVAGFRHGLCLPQTASSFLSVLVCEIHKIIVIIGPHKILSSCERQPWSWCLQPSASPWPPLSDSLRPWLMVAAIFTKWPPRGYARECQPEWAVSLWGPAGGGGLAQGLLAVPPEASATPLLIRAHAGQLDTVDWLLLHVGVRMARDAQGPGWSMASPGESVKSLWGRQGELLPGTLADLGVNQ